MHGDTYRSWFETLRAKWFVVPGEISQRYDTNDLNALSDNELLSFWTKSHRRETTGERFGVRGWYHTLYKDVLRGKHVIDIGSGLGYDAITFALSGAAHVTCADILEPNLRLLERLGRLLGVADTMDFHYIEDVGSLGDLSGGYEVIWAQGSLINAPFPVIRAEVQELLAKAAPGARWIELAYPRERWEREGSLPFEAWGEKTDGPGTPYMEWYDIEKMRRLFHPHAVEVVLNFNFHNNDFNWFDLLLTNADEEGA